MNPNLKIEKRILNISFVGSVIFLIAEVVMALVTGSNAVFMDCVFDIADLIMIGPFMLLIPLLYKNETEKRPYGFSQVESLFVLIKASVLIAATVFLGVDSIKLIASGGNEVDAGIVAVFELLVSLICVIMYLCLNRLNKKYTSPSVQTEVYIWKLDSLSTLGVGLGFILKCVLDNIGLSSIGNYIDPVIALVLAVFLLKEPVSLFWQSIKNLVLFAPDDETTSRIRMICSKILEKYDCYINFLDIVKTGRKYWVVVYFVVDKDLISIDKLRKINSLISKELDKEFDSVSIELIPEVEKVKFEDVKRKSIARRPDKINYIENKTTVKENKSNKKNKNIKLKRA